MPEGLLSEHSESVENLRGRCLTTLGLCLGPTSSSHTLWQINGFLLASWLEREGAGGVTLDSEDHVQALSEAVSVDVDRSGV